MRAISRASGRIGPSIVAPREAILLSVFLIIVSPARMATVVRSLKSRSAAVWRLTPVVSMIIEKAMGL